MSNDLYKEMRELRTALKALTEAYRLLEPYDTVGLYRTVRTPYPNDNYDVVTNAIVRTTRRLKEIEQEVRRLQEGSVNAEVSV